MATEPSSEAGGTRSVPTRRTVLLLLVLGIILGYLPSLSYPFTNWDDPVYVQENPYLRSLAPANISRMFTDTYDANYFPLTLLSYAVDFAIAGAAPAWVRLHSVLWHAGSTVLLALLLLRLVPRLAPWLAALFALYFGLHPLRYESVLWISERKDVLCAFFFLLALYLHVRSSPWTAAPYRHRAFPWILQIFILALLSKSMAVTLPLLIILHDLFLARDRVRERVPVYAILLAIALGCAALTVWSQRSAMSQPGSLAFTARLANATSAPAYHVQKTLFPADLSPLRPLRYAPAWLSPRHLAGLGVSLGLAAGIFVFRRRNPEAAFGLTWFLVVLAPVSGILTVGHAWIADRYSYLPSAGLVLAAAVLTTRLPNRFRWTPIAALAALLLLASPATAYTAWSSSEALWRRVLTVYPDYAPAKLDLGQALYTTGNHQAALDLLEQTPDERKTGTRADILYREAAAAGDFRRAEAILAGCPNPRIRLRGEINLHLLRKQVTEAAAAARKLLQEPQRSSTDVGLAANALLIAGLEREAEAVLTSLRSPSLAAAAVMGQLANVKLERGDLAGASRWAAQADLTDPAQYDTARATLLLLCARHRFSEAARRADRILRQPDVSLPTRQLVWGILGYAETKRNRLPAALAACREAIRLGNQDPGVRKNAEAAAKALGVTPDLPPGHNAN